ncbi:MAG: hypothetical protein Q9160_006913 [Pyrenula sp. 1 TL-2023]
MNHGRTYFFAASLVVAIIIQTLAGAASAVLVVPQLRWCDVHEPFGGLHGFFYLNASHEYMWPSDINETIVAAECDIIDFDIAENCPYAGLNAISRSSWEYIRQFSFPNISITTNANVVRYLGASVYSDDGYSASSTGMGHITRDLGNVWTYALRNDKRLAIPEMGRPKLTLTSEDESRPIMRPIVQTHCEMPIDISDIEDNLQSLTFNMSGLIYKPDEHLSRGEVTKSLNISNLRDGSPKVEFVDLSEESGRPMLGALIGMQFYNAKALPLVANTAQGLLACTLAAHWTPTNMSTDPRVDNVAALEESYPRPALKSKTFAEYSRPITIDATYANKVNSVIPGAKGRVLEYELQHLAVQQGDPGRGLPYVYDGTWTRKWPYVIASLVSMQMADALARVKTKMTMMAYCGRCADQKNNPGSSTIQDLSIQNSPYSAPLTNLSRDEFVINIKSQPDLYHPVEWHVERYGYGWSLNDVTKKLSAALVLIHVILVFLHVAIVSWRRWRYELWGSAIELLALANVSPPMKEMRDVGAGTAIEDAYSRRVVIRSSQENGEPILAAASS